MHKSKQNCITLYGEVYLSPTNDLNKIQWRKKSILKNNQQFYSYYLQENSPMDGQTKYIRDILTLF